MHTGYFSATFSSAGKTLLTSSDPMFNQQRENRFHIVAHVHHRCSLKTVKSQPEGSPFKWETRLCRVSHFNDGPEGWDLLSTMNIKDQFFFSHTSAKKTVVSLEPPPFRGHGSSRLKERGKTIISESQIIFVPKYSF